MLNVLTVEDITRDLAGYLRQLAAGETVLVTRADQPLAEIKPVPAEHRMMRLFGRCPHAIILLYQRNLDRSYTFGDFFADGNNSS